MRELPRETIASYIAALQKRLHTYALKHGLCEECECIKLDLFFAKQWLEMGEQHWSLGCVRNAFDHALSLGVIPRLRRQIFA